MCMRGSGSDENDEWRCFFQRVEVFLGYYFDVGRGIHWFWRLAGVCVGLQWKGEGGWKGHEGQVY